MNTSSWTRSTLRVMAATLGAAAGAYGVYAALTWLRYGHVPHSADDESDHLLDRVMPEYDVVERHRIRVAAPASMTLTAAREQDLLNLPLVRPIFRMREIVLGATPTERPQPRGLIDATLALGWGVLAEVPGREIVMGAVTKPWEPDVTFHALPPDEFAAFREPGFVKIAWTLRVDPIDEETSMFRTETRAVATDGTARAWFSRYWAFASPGIGLIRWFSLGPLKAEAERRGARGRVWSV
jgi:hypothetical protein